MEEEGLAVVTGHAFDFAEEDGVIAGGIFRDEIASEMREGAFQKRDARFRPLKTDAQLIFDFGGLLAFREMLGESLLMLAKDADAKAPLRFEEGEQAGVVGNTHEDEERLQRDRREGIGGHAMDAAGFALDGDDGDTRGEGARDATEECGVPSGSGHYADEFKIAQAFG